MTMTDNGSQPSGIISLIGMITVLHETEDTMEKSLYDGHPRHSAIYSNQASLVDSLLHSQKQLKTLLLSCYSSPAWSIKGS